jgi:glycosyltransferase involved in cell wall biosynthesis
MLKILHLVEFIGLDGRTRLLGDLVAHTGKQFDHKVLSLGYGGVHEKVIQDLDAEVEILGPQRLPFIGEQYMAFKRIKAFQPDVVVCWSGRTNLTSTWVALERIPVVWTIHNVYEKLFSPKEKLALLVSAYLSSRVPYKIVCCCDAVADVYARHHRYADNKLIVIPNGVDTSKFKPDSAVCQSMKSELNLDDKTIVITIAGGFRLDDRPDKDFASFIKAAGIVHEQYPNIKYLMCGYGLNWHNSRLVSWIKDSGIERVTQLLGPRDDLHRILAATDIIVSSSQFEAFGTTIFEGMASGAVPVCTDVGEMPKGARDIGRVVPTGDPRMLANAMCELIELDRNERALLSAKAVARVAEQYSIRITAEHYSSLFKEIVAQH